MTLPAPARLAAGLALGLLLPAPAHAQVPPAPSPAPASPAGNPQPPIPWRVGTPHPHRAGSGTTAAFSPDGRLLATLDPGRAVRILDVLTGRDAALIEPADPRVTFCAFAFAPGGLTFAAAPATPDGQALCFWNVRDGAELLRRPLARDGRDDGVVALAFAPDGRRLAAGRRNRTVEIWDLPPGFPADGTEPDGPQVLRAHTDAVSAVTFSPDGGTIATAGDEMAIALRGVHPWRRPAHGSRITSLAFSPDGRTLASSSYDGSVRLWDVTRGDEVRVLQWPGRPKPVAPNEGIVNPLATVMFSADGRRIAVADYRNSVCLWTLPTGTADIVLSGGAGDVIAAIAFLPGDRLAAGLADGTALVWEIGGPPAPDPAGTPPDAAALEAAWEALRGDDPQGAWEAGDTLAAAGDAAVAFLEGRLPAPEGEDARITRLIAALDADAFEDRERTSQELRAFGPEAAPALRRALADSPSAEVRVRAEAVLAALDRPRLPPPGDALRRLLALRVLERIGTPAARAAIDRLRDLK